MNIIQANTIKQLQELLKQFDKNLPVAIFDSDRGYMSVAFKKEEKRQGNNTFQWLTFYPHETIQMYSIGTLIGYLDKLPPKATISIQDENLQYSDLFLSLDGMKDNGKFLNWLVISNELEYDRFFRQHEDVEDVKEVPLKPVNTDNHTLDLALDKMLEEMKDNSSKSIERVHQWLCKQDDLELFQGILTEGKTINGAIAFCSKKAQELSSKGQFGMFVEDETVYEWIKDYFINYELPKPKKEEIYLPPKKKKVPVNTVTKTSQSTPNTEEKENEQQIALFELV